MGLRIAEKRNILPLEPPRWRVLPPEIVHIIMEMLGTDKKTLSACALVSREFTFAALCFIGRHLTINTSHRLQECVNLLTNGSRLAAFQHVRSLDIGITSKRIVQQQRYWDDYLIILDVFARRRHLTRLWLSEVPFCFSDSGMRDRARNVLISLTSTVNDLGIYSCHFSSYPDIVSLIRSFPLCTSLYVRDCVVRGGPGSNVFAGLPQHTLRISDLELTSSPGYRPTVDLSTLIKDTALDISSLTRFSCSMTTADQARRALMFATASPIESLQFICEEAEGFHVLADPLLTSWPLKSLTIGPILHKDDSWCGRALNLNPNFPSLETVTVLACYERPVNYCLRFWSKVDRILSRKHMFPRLRRLDICITLGSLRVQHGMNLNILQYLPNLRRVRKVRLWGTEPDLPPFAYH